MPSNPPIVPQLIADYACETGENPLWHPLEKRLYWTDIPAGRLFRYDPQTGQHEVCYQGRPVGGFTIQPDGALLLFMDRGTVALWRDGQLTTVIDEIPDERDSRFNDVIADPAGRVFCGTMPAPDPRPPDQAPARLGRLYRLDGDGTCTRLLDGIGCSNGMGFTLEGRHMYYTDSAAFTIWRFDYDAATGELTNQQVFLKADEADGFPDGMTVDSDGCVWTARWGGWAVVQYGPDGIEQRRIALPTEQVASLTFGGEDLTDLYIATAGGHDKARYGQAAGALFCARPGVRGNPEFFSRIHRT